MQLKIVFIWIVFTVLLKLEASNIKPFYGPQLCDSSVILMQLKDAANASKLLSYLSEHNTGKKISCSKLFPDHKDEQLGRIYKIISGSAGQGLDILKLLNGSGLVVYVEFAPVYNSFSTPDDLNVRQWHLKKIQAEAAWGLNTGLTDIKIAIVDDAVEIAHEDLKGSIYRNLSEIPGNGLDDDANGYIDDINGWHAFYKHGNPNPPITGRSSHSHGTHCAGIAAAKTNNTTGIASIGYSVSIIPVACTDSFRPGLINAGYEGITYAADAGAHVISLSWGGSYFSNTGQIVINYALGKGAVICAAAGNSNVDTKMYPAAYNGVIAVAASNSSDQKAGFSNYGSWIDVTAPGAGIWSTVCGYSSPYSYMSGTSMACPLTAGLCALMLSRNKKLSPAALEACLKSSADNINAANPGFNNLLGAGRINAHKALQCVKPIYADFTADKTLVCPGETIQFTSKSSSNVVAYSWYVNGAVPTFSTAQNPQFTFLNSGYYRVKLKVFDGLVYDSVEISNYIEVRPVFARMRTGINKIKTGETAFLSVLLEGQAPWKLDISDGSSVSSYTAVNENPFYFDVSPDKTTKYFIASVSDGRCIGLSADTSVVYIDANEKTADLPCSSGDLFSNVYHFGSRELPHYMKLLKDGNTAVIGIASPGAIGGDDIFMSKINKDGHVIWTKFYGTVSGEAGYPLGIAEDDSFNYYIFGSSMAGSVARSYLVKTDSSGAIKFSKRSVSGSVGDHIRGATMMSDSNMIYVSTSAVTNDQAAGVRVESKQGRQIWRRSFNSSGQTEHFTDVHEISKSVYLIGATSVGSGAYGTIIAKMDRTGNLKWQKYIDYQMWDAGFFAEVTHQPGFLINHRMSVSGASEFGQEDFGLLHCDTNGNRIWSKILGESGIDVCSGLLKIKDYYYVSGTTTSFDNGNSKLFLIKMDINGNILWSRIYGKPGEKIFKTQFGRLMTMSQDSNILLSGYVNQGNEDLIVYKIDQCGNSNCTWTDAVFKVKTVNPNISNSTLADLGLINLSNLFSNTTNAGSVQTTAFCPRKPVNACRIHADFRYIYTCINDSVRFTDLSVDSLNRAIRHHKWIFHDAYVISGNNTAAYKYPSLGSYAVKLVVFSDTPGMCSDTITKVIMLDKRLSSKIVYGRDSICKNDSVHLQVNAICGQSPYTISWIPAQYFDNPASMNPIARPPVSMWLKYRLTDSQNSVSLDSVYIKVDQNCCVYNPSIALSDTALCAGDTLDVENNTAVAGSTSRWKVFLNGNAIDSFLGDKIQGYLPAKSGHYLFRLQVSGACSSGQSDVNVFVQPLPHAHAGTDTSLCGPFQFEIGSETMSRHQYLWGPAEGLNSVTLSNPLAYIQKAMRYHVRVIDLETSCENSDTVNIGFREPFEGLGRDTSFCDGGSVQIGVYTQKPGLSYMWQDGMSLPNRKIHTAGVYVLQRRDQCGVLSDTIVLQSKVCFCDLFVPNAFSPDGNAINEYFPAEVLETEIHIQIFNRWGEKLVDKRNTTTGWDGTYQDHTVQEGIYVYLISYKNCKGIYRQISGTFTLLR